MDKDRIRAQIAFAKELFWNRAGALLGAVVVLFGAFDFVVSLIPPTEVVPTIPWWVRLTVTAPVYAYAVYWAAHVMVQRARDEAEREGKDLKKKYDQGIQELKNKYEAHAVFQSRKELDARQLDYLNTHLMIGSNILKDEATNRDEWNKQVADWEATLIEYVDVIGIKRPELFDQIKPRWLVRGQYPGESLDEDREIFRAEFQRLQAFADMLSRKRAIIVI